MQYLIVIASVISVISHAFGSLNDVVPVEPTHISLKDGDKALLVCPIQDTDSRDISWTRDDLPIDDTLKVAEGSKIFKYVINETANALLVNKVYRADVGNYTCSNGDRVETVELQAAPRLLNPHVLSVTVTEDGILRHTCEGWAYPSQLSATWWKGDEELVANDVKYFIEDVEASEDTDQITNGMLIIEGIQRSERDYYKCKVTNGVSVKEHQVLVRVKGKLAALWPFLGIVVVLTILAIIIILWERDQKKKEAEEKDE